MQYQREVNNNFDQDHHIILLNNDIINACTHLPDDFFSLIITSPPYNIGKIYEEQVSLKSYLDWQSEVISEMVRVLHPKGSLCWQVGNFVDNGEIFPLDMYFYHIFKNMNLKLRNRVIWHFDHGLHTQKRLSGRYETLLWFTKSDNYTFNLDPIRIPSKYPGKLHYKGEKKGQPSGNPLGKNPSDFWRLLQTEWDEGIWEIPNVKANHPEKTTHPCQFPIELVERCVLSMTNENDWILDPFVGAGSSVIAAIKNNRRVIGIDKDAQYCELTRQRVNDFYAGTLKIRPLGKPVHVPTGREKVAQVPMQWLEKGE